MQIIPDATGLISERDQNDNVLAIFSNVFDAYFISTVNILARKYDIQVQTDPINRIANFIGGTSEQHQSLAQDVTNTLWRYVE